MSFWRNKRVVVTGGTGFIGSHVVEALEKAQCPEIFVVRHKEYDLSKEEDVVRLLERARPDIVLHLAGLVGGIAANKARPADFFYQNLTMGTFVVHHSWRLGVKKLVAAGAGCGYPEHAPVPLREESFWEGLPQAESAPYSLAKRLLHIQAIGYFRQHGFPAVVAIPGNAYGPHDNFDLEASHVVPALIRKFVDAVDRGSDEVTVWGTGRPTRDFVYAGDVVRGILLAAERYETPELVNISSGVETSIRELAQMIAEAAGFRGRIIWDPSRPDGQLRRCFDIGKARADLGFEPQVSLGEGLRRTVAWYQENRALVRMNV
ncbi:MAG TPA: GDP-L-fucose synthase [bacterium]|nr:GDP-L-fucose synthase [bacterium]